IRAAPTRALRQLAIGSIEQLVCRFTRSLVEAVKGMHLVYTETVRISSLTCLANASATLPSAFFIAAMIAQSVSLYSGFFLAISLAIAKHHRWLPSRQVEFDNG